MNDPLIKDLAFPTNIYRIEKPEFLEVARTVSLDFLDKRRGEVELNEAFPCFMTESINADPRLLNFANYVAQTAWNILQEQGYQVQDSTTYFTEMWCQEHHKGSLMEQHVHGNGNQIVGFYFLDVPENSSRVLFYDPKPGKVQINLPEVDVNQLTPASNMINYKTKEGMLLFTNAWLAHSFTRNMADTPMRFIHFNVSVMKNQSSISHNCPVEVV